MSTQKCQTCSVQRSFCPLPEPLRAVFQELKTNVAYEKREVVFREADACHSIFVVCDGSLKLITESKEGKVLLLRFAGPGEILGLAETILGGKPYECSAIAAEPSVVAVIPRETFMRLVASPGEILLCITRALAEQYAIAQREAKFLAFGETSLARLARLLVEWSQERGERCVDGLHLSPNATHIDLAQWIGSTRETVTRVLGDLSHRGIIERHGDEIVIHESDELKRLAEF